MIKISGLTKRFDDVCAINNISMEIPEGIVFGLLGTNGAGKTTLLRLMTGILDADAGKIELDGEDIAQSVFCKEKIFYLPDTPYYFTNANMNVMLDFYKEQYPSMESENVTYLANALDLDMNRSLRTFSKGMKRQAFLTLALSAGTKYLLCDEIFDGLDPIATDIMKKLFRDEMKERNLTVVVASHKLKELEDICSNIAILYKGGISTEKDIKRKTENIHKYQCALKNDFDTSLLDHYPFILRCKKENHFITLIAKTELCDISNVLQQFDPIFVKEVPLSLEETFIVEMGDTGYDIKKIFQ